MVPLAPRVSLLVPGRTIDALNTSVNMLLIPPATGADDNGKWRNGRPEGDGDYLTSAGATGGVGGRIVGGRRWAGG